MTGSRKVFISAVDRYLTDIVVSKVVLNDIRQVPGEILYWGVLLGQLNPSIAFTQAYTPVTPGVRLVADHSRLLNSWSFWVVADDHAMVLLTFGLAFADL